MMMEILDVAVSEPYSHPEELLRILQRCSGSAAVHRCLSAGCVVCRYKEAQYISKC